jgi:hypothetical protein
MRLRQGMHRVQIQRSDAGVADLDDATHGSERIRRNEQHGRTVDIDLQNADHTPRLQDIHNALDTPSLLSSCQARELDRAVRDEGRCG